MSSKILVQILIAYLLLSGCQTDSSSIEESLSSTLINQQNHPLDALSSDEISLIVQILKSDEKFNENTLVGDIKLIEPEKALIYDWKFGDAFARKAEVILRNGNNTFEGIVDVTNKSILRWKQLEDIQSAIIIDDFMKADEVWRTDQRVIQALSSRGYAIDDVMGVPLSPGYFDKKDARDKRLLKVWLLDIKDVKTNLYAKPINGITPVVDVNTGKVADLYITQDDARNDTTYDYDDASLDIKKSKPVKIISPEGNNYQFKNGLVHWGDWSFHVKFGKRLGVIISLANFKNQSVAYQLSLGEMFVPYMDPSEDWRYRSYMDVGEYGFGLLATALTPGADIPENATLYSSPIVMDDGSPVIMENVIGLFERNTGRPAWRHSEFLNETNESREEVELVLRTIPVVGNYDYVIDYVFSAKGTISVQVGATGMDAAKATKSKSMEDPTAIFDTKVGNLIAPNLIGVYHDHFLSFRIDMDVDGTHNTLVTDEILPVRYKDNIRKSGWEVVEHPTITEGSVSAEKNNHSGFYRVVNKNSKNKLGQYKGYQIIGHTHLSQLDDDDYPQKRAAWSKEQLWVTPYNKEERYPSGKYPNQSDGSDGILEWTSKQRSVDNTDIVCWYTMGFHHITRPEDWPVLPTLWHDFTLRPSMSFNQNPAINVSK